MCKIQLVGSIDKKKLLASAIVINCDILVLNSDPVIAEPGKPSRSKIQQPVLIKVSDSKLRGPVAAMAATLLTLTPVLHHGMVTSPASRAVSDAQQGASSERCFGNKKHAGLCSSRPLPLPAPGPCR